MSIPGQNSGHPMFDWQAYVAWLVEQHGSLAAVAEALADARQHREGVESIERALRRLRGRGGRSGGVWGQRCLQRFGLPGTVQRRLRWMGHYHSRFSDLPVSLCEELLQAWEGTPVRDSPQSGWLALGRASVALRRRDPDAALLTLERCARLDARLELGARVEWRLVRAYALSRRDAAEVDALLVEAEALLAELGSGEDQACLYARWVDQRAYPLNRGTVPRPEAAEALYRTIDPNGPPFARCRRGTGLAWSLWRQGKAVEARQEVRGAVQAAGDAGALRLRSMALAALARMTEGEEAVDAARRARELATRLEDPTLAHRLRPRAPDVP